VGFRITSASVCNVRSGNLSARSSILIAWPSIYLPITERVISRINMDVLSSRVY